MYVYAFNICALTVCRTIDLTDSTKCEEHPLLGQGVFIIWADNDTTKRSLATIKTESRSDLIRWLAAIETAQTEWDWTGYSVKFCFTACKALFIYSI
jgi:hypothetical protein